MRGCSSESERVKATERRPLDCAASLCLPVPLCFAPLQQLHSHSHHIPLPHRTKPSLIDSELVIALTDRETTLAQLVRNLQRKHRAHGRAPLRAEPVCSPLPRVCVSAAHVEFRLFAAACWCVACRCRVARNAPQPHAQVTRPLLSLLRLPAWIARRCFRAAYQRSIPPLRCPNLATDAQRCRTSRTLPRHHRSTCHSFFMRPSRPSSCLNSVTRCKKDWSGSER